MILALAGDVPVAVATVVVGADRHPRRQLGSEEALVAGEAQVDDGDAHVLSEVPGGVQSRGADPIRALGPDLRDRFRVEQRQGRRGRST